MALVFIRSVKKKHIVVIIEAYHYRQLHTKFYPTSSCQERKLLEIISVAFDIKCQLLIIHSAFVKYLRKSGNKMDRRVSYLYTWEYNESVHQLFIYFKKAYDSVRRQVLYNILIEFGIPM